MDDSLLQISRQITPESYFNPAIPKYRMAGGLTSDPHCCLSEIWTALNKLTEQSMAIHYADTLWLPLLLNDYCERTRIDRGGGYPVSLSRYLLENHPYLKHIIKIPELTAIAVAFDSRYSACSQGASQWLTTEAIYRPYSIIILLNAL